MNNLFNTIYYWLSKKSEPIFNDYKKIITDFTELTPKTTDAYDLNGRQIYVSGPSKYGLFICDKLTPQEIQYYKNDFETNYPGVIAKYEWIYKSMACNSYSKWRIDIYKPGRMIVKCNLPKYTWAAAWFYQSMNKGDFPKPWLLPIDKPLLEPREYYFEIDSFENMMNKDNMKMVFTGHYGTQTDRKMKSSSMCWKENNGMHFIEVVWDGTGNWTWLLNSVIIQKAFIPQPTEKIFPYLYLTLGMCDDYINIQYPVMWKVDWIKISDNIILL